MKDVHARDPIFRCSGQMAELYSDLDWSSTPLGPVGSWPECLRNAAALLLRSAFPMVLNWGESLVTIYNDAYVPILSTKHPASVGGLLADQFPEVWDQVEPMMRSVTETGEPVYAEDLPFWLEGEDGLEETFFTFSYSHVPDPSGPGGVLAVVAMTTAAVVDRRRLALLNQLAAQATSTTHRDEAIRASLAVLATAHDDLRHGALVVVGDGETDLVARFGAGPAGWSESPAARSAVAGAVAARHRAVERDDLAEEPQCLVAIPVRDREHQTTVLLLAPHPQRPLDEEHHRFLGLVADQIGQIIGLVDARAAEQEQLAALAELDAAKSFFLSNISHEFRTPLTLLLGPLEAVIAGRSDGVHADDARTMHRSTMRLLRMVNALLDIATMESGAHVPQWQAVDVRALTTDLLEPFGPAARRVGLDFETHLSDEVGVVDCDPALWETIVLNLVANALKYTLVGSVTVTLEVVGVDKVLTVTDTGVGIAAEDLPHVFDRFQRVAGRGGRTVEGTGIGLALVRDAATSLGGSVSVTSQVGVGSTFTARLPLSSAPGQHPVSSTERGAAMAAAWAEDLTPAPDTTVDPGDLAGQEGPLLLVVDDNAAMRGRLRQVLGGLGRVLTARDGVEALEVLRQHPIDLVVSDVMMPRLDGLGLVSAIRADPVLMTVPIVLVSARAGTGSTVDALGAQADDYVVKPFTEEELVARCRATLELSRLRAEATAVTRSRAMMLAGVSHDMQTPLAIVISALTLLAEDPALSPDQRSVAARAVLRGDQLGRLVLTFLDWSRITHGVDLSPRIRTVDVVGELERLTRQHPAAQFAPPTAPIMVAIDVNRTVNIVHNLLDNATRVATGEVTIELVDRPDDAVDVVVSDDGPGVDPAVLPRLFESFVSSSERGTGLGLHVSRLAARAQGGELRLASTGPGGAAFVLTVPLADTAVAT